MVAEKGWKRRQTLRRTSRNWMRNAPHLPTAWRRSHIASTDLGLSPTGRLDSVRVRRYGNSGRKEGHARRRLQIQWSKFDFAEGDAENQTSSQDRPRFHPSCDR